MAVREKHTKSFTEAVRMAFGEAELDDMNYEMASLFGTVLESKTDREQIAKITTSSLRMQYGKGAKWHSNDWWMIAVPMPQYEDRGVPCLVVETSFWLVVSATVKPEWSKVSRYVTVAAPWNKPVRTILPLSFIRSLLEGSDDRYRIVGKDGSWTLREIVGSKQPLRLNDDFIEELKAVLGRKPLADWLDDFGSRGRLLCPLVVGAMLGLIYRDKQTQLPIEEQPWDMATLIAAVNSLGYSTTRVQKAIEQAGPELRPEMSLEDALPVLLRHMK